MVRFSNSCLYRVLIPGLLAKNRPLAARKWSSRMHRLGLSIQSMEPRTSCIGKREYGFWGTVMNRPCHHRFGGDYKSVLFRLPFIGICIALYIKKEPRIGIVYNPILNELYSARNGRGAYKNGFPIHVSGTTGMCNGSLCLDYIPCSSIPD